MRLKFLLKFKVQTLFSKIKALLQVVKYAEYEHSLLRKVYLPPTYMNDIVIGLETNDSPVRKASRRTLIVALPCCDKYKIEEAITPKKFIALNWKYNE